MKLTTYITSSTVRGDDLCLVVSVTGGDDDDPINMAVGVVVPFTATTAEINAQVATVAVGAVRGWLDSQAERSSEKSSDPMQVRVMGSGDDGVREVV